MIRHFVLMPPRFFRLNAMEHARGGLMMGRSGGRRSLLLLCLLLSWFVSPAAAQELEPRRWTHLPVDTNFFGAAYARTHADIDFNPALRLEDVDMKMNTVAAGYIRTFAVFDRLVRAEVKQAWHDGRWEGTINGQPVSTNRRGFGDTVIRAATYLVGAPPLAGKDYAAYRAAADVETIVGLALAVQLPTGEYKKNKLINLGNNRFTFRPQLGVVHNRGPWGFEVTLSPWFYTDNDSFFDGGTLKQDPLYTGQAHVVYTIRPGLWVAGSGGMGVGGETTVNGNENNDDKENIGFAFTSGYAITRWLGVQAGYVGFRRLEETGSDSDTLFVGLSTFF